MPGGGQKSCPGGGEIAKGGGVKRKYFNGQKNFSRLKKQRKKMVCPNFRDIVYLYFFHFEHYLNFLSELYNLSFLLSAVHITVYFEIYRQR